MDSRDTTDFFNEELREAMAEGRVIIEFSDTSDEDNNNVQFSVRPAENFTSAAAPVPDSVELALAQRNVEILGEKLEEREEALKQDIESLRSRLRTCEEERKILRDKLLTKASTVVEKQTRIIHRRCWGSWFLAVLVAAELYFRHHDEIINWLAWLHTN